ncbi:MAG: hypothetical protein DME22_14875 [Verrucomicrobia bacterium]|nr:MAG: hypothetical protein DME22_14875 [Verrucomicrobiota bacterium]PYJ95412.1 MAG: hypothetical protein DME23_24005 [Verrucomicrobiota bacterium]
MNPLWKIRGLAIALIVFFGLGTILAVPSLFTAGSSPLLFFAVATNLGFVAGGIGLIKLKRWSWWLTIGLCAVSIIQLLWQIVTTLTPETATKQNEIVSYVVAGFYLAIAFLLTSNSVRKTFRKRHGQDA